MYEIDNSYVLHDVSHVCDTGLWWRSVRRACMMLVANVLNIKT